MLQTCPRCGNPGKRRAYVNHDKYVYIRFEHWDGLKQTQCYIRKEVLR